MKKLQHHTLLVALATLAAAAGCTDDAEAPAPERILASEASTVAGDLAPTELFDRAPVAEVADQPVTVSLPASPQTPLTDWEVPEGREYRSTHIFVPAGSSAGRVQIPIDTATDAQIFLAGTMSADTPEELAELNQEVLHDVRLFAPDGSGPLNARPGPEADDAAPGQADLDGRTVERPESDTDAPADATGTAEGTVAGSGSTTVAPPSATAVHPVNPEDAPDRASPLIELGEDAQSGTYVLEYGDRAGELGLVIDVRQPASPIRLELAASAHQVLLGGSGHVDVRLDDGDDPLSGTIEAKLLRDGTEVGAPPVQRLGQGRYRVNVMEVLGPDSPTGAHNLYVRARGNGFDRYGWTAFHFAVPTARIVAATTPTLVRDDDEKIEALEVPVELEVRAHDRFEVNGTLVWVDSSGAARPVATAQTAAGLEPGEHTLKLRFDAGHLRLLGEDGRFELRQVTLFAQDQAATLHRMQGGLGIETPELEPGDLAEAEMTPQLETLIEQNVYDL